MNGEPISPYWPIIYAFAGGLLAVMGQVISEWLQSRRTFKATKREERRKQLYALQDQVITLFELTRKQVSDATDPFNPAGALFIDRNKVRNAITRISAYSVRVGDDPLARHVDGMAKALLHAADNPSNANTKIREAHTHLGSMELRVGELLHTDIEVDTGVGNHR